MSTNEKSFTIKNGGIILLNKNDNFCNFINDIYLMNLQQLEYIIAIERYRHFAQAAEHCHVTQPTLSMMINKLENELGIRIFDRSHHPVIPTQDGIEIINQAKRVLAETNRIKQIVTDIKGEIRGVLKLGIIPTVAPFLLPLFVNDFLKRYPNLKLSISENTTEYIVEKLQNGELDVGILATPLYIESIRELPLYHEEFVVYSSNKSDFISKEKIIPKDIDLNKLWLLEEGHCMRSQVINLCELKKKEKSDTNLQYEVGSIDTLKRLVDSNDGITILPELAVLDFHEKEKRHLHYFKPPVPVREISIVTYQHFVKERLINLLKVEIINAVRPYAENNKSFEIIEIDLPFMKNKS